MLNKYYISAIALIFAVISSYIFQFYFNLGYRISDNPSDWVDFGDFFNGLTSPILSFISMMLLIHSLNLQNQANKELRDEIKINQKREHIRSFESYFFSLIEAQRTAFSQFRIEINRDGNTASKNGVSAIIFIEDYISYMREFHLTDDKIKRYLERVDKNENIHNVIRIFYNIVNIINEKISEKNGFNEKDREIQIRSLISLTEFSQLRLVMIGIQFLEYHSCDALRKNKEFISILEKLGAKINLY
jgi:hypothetical protein